MIVFRVYCADRTTGEDYTIEVEAERPGQAVKIAADNGHLASRAEVIRKKIENRGVIRADDTDPRTDAAQAAHNTAMLEEARKARIAAEKHHSFSIGRVIALFVLIMGIPLFCIFGSFLRELWIRLFGDGG